MDAEGAFPKHQHHHAGIKGTFPKRHHPMETNFAFPKHHDLGGPPGFSSVGFAFIGIGAFWTLLILGILIYLGLNVVFNPHSTVTKSFKLRGVFIIPISILLIQAYLLWIFVTYSLNNVIKCSHEFWITNTLFPAVTACFMAVSFRLLAKGKRQTLCIKEKIWGKSPKSFSFKPQEFKAWITHRPTEIYFEMSLAFGFLVLLGLASAMFFESRRFNPEGGIFGPIAVDAHDCRRGVEWVPAVAYQFINSWILGPVLILKSYEIVETLLLGVQIRWTIALSLPGPVLWAVFLLCDYPFNDWLPPAFWLVPGLMGMQGLILYCTLFGGRYVDPHNRFESTIFFNDPMHLQNLAMRNLDMADIAMSRDALEYNIINHCDPFHKYAEGPGTVQFIDFWLRVRNWKQHWGTLFQNASPKDEARLASDCYFDALRIYMDLLEDNSDYDVIASQYEVLEGLRKVFGTNVHRLGRPLPEPERHEGCFGPNVALGPFGQQRHFELRMEREREGVRIYLPPGFDLKVFDVARADALDRLYESTWPAFLAGKSVRQLLAGGYIHLPVGMLARQSSV